MEYANFAGFPATGETGKIYVAIDTGDVYRWGGSSYVQINDAVTSADQATKLATARNIALTGAITGTASFDGTADANISTTLDISGKTTSDLSEGSNLYYTDTRARSSVSATGSIAYNSGTGVFSFTQGNTDTISEGSTNLYYTDARVQTVIDSNSAGFITPSSSSTLTNKTGNISQWTNDSGYLTSETDSQTLSFSSPSISITGGNSINISALTTGLITASSTDTLTNKTGNISMFTNDAGYITSETDNQTIAFASPVLTISGSNSTADLSSLVTGFITASSTETLTNKTISGSDNTISNIPNSALVGSGAITVNGSAVSLGGSVTIGETKPTITSISPSTITNAESTITITGSNYLVGTQVEFINTSTGIWYPATTIVYNNGTSLTATITLSVDAQYRMRIENPDGNAVISTSNILTVSDAPTWSTSAGSLGSFAGNFSGTIASLSASSDSAVTFSEVGSNLTTANVTLSSAGVLSTTDFGGSSTSPTTYNFTIRVTDAEAQTADRSFSFASTFGATGGGQFN